MFLTSTSILISVVQPLLWAFKKHRKNPAMMENGAQIGENKQVVQMDKSQP